MSICLHEPLVWVECSSAVKCRAVCLRVSVCEPDCQCNWIDSSHCEGCTRVNWCVFLESFPDALSSFLLVPLLFLLPPTYFCCDPNQDRKAGEAASASGRWASSSCGKRNQKADQRSLLVWGKRAVSLISVKSSWKCLSRPWYMMMVQFQSWRITLANCDRCKLKCANI